MDTTKICSKCGKCKQKSEYTPRPDRPVGVYASCKECKRKSSRERRRARRVTEPEALWKHSAFHWAKDRAKKALIPFELSHEDIKLRHDCSYCGKLLNFRATMKDRKDSPSLDRIIPNLGYIIQNVVVCCYRCNAIKNEASPDELQQLAEAVLGVALSRGLTWK